jgi:hypothetical protein
MGVDLKFHDGASHAIIDGVPAAKPRPRKAKAKAPDGTDQGDLF